MAQESKADTAAETLPKHQVLRNWILAQFESGDLMPGDRLPSEHELAARFKYSRQTIRHAIGTLETEGWLERRQGSGTYATSKTLTARRRTRTVAVLTTYLDDYIFPDIIRGIERILTPAGCSLSLHLTRNGTEREAECLHDILAQPVDGLIAEGTKSAFPNPNLALYQKLSERGVPVVFINGGYAGLDAAAVLLDDEEAGRLAADSLLTLGHQDLGAMFKVDDIQGHRRYAGFLKAHHDHGLKVREDRVLWFTTEDQSLLSEPDYDNVLLRRFAGVTGLVCYNDQVALGLLGSLRRIGLSVPGDLSVVGIDDSHLAGIAVPPLTTVAHPRAILGTVAANHLLRMMSGDAERVSEVLPPRLVVRESTAPPNRGVHWPPMAATTP
jgi:GntR family transcriptional regulator of arabinose operon